MDKITTEQLLGAVVVIMALLSSYNIFATSRANARKEQEHKEAPVKKLREDVDKLTDDLDTERRRIDELQRELDHHDDDLKDLHAGQSALCRGVQALLDHELHNGNEDDMKEASASIGKWLLGRKG